MVNNTFDNLDDAVVYDSENKKIGSVGQVYLDDQTQQPKFITVNTGFFGTKESFIPVDSAERTEDGLRVPYTSEFVKGAPNLDDDGHLSPEEEDRLFEYYSMNAQAGAAGGRTPGLETDLDLGGRDDISTTDRLDGAEFDGSDRLDGAGFDRAGLDADRESAEGGIVAHEERLNVGKEQQEAGRVRLSKRVRTEQQMVEVPLQREELVVEREAIDPDSAEARVGGRIEEDGGEEEVIVLREERPVVSKETVATERVNVGKRTVEESQTVSADVRKEEIEIQQEGERLTADRVDGADYREGQDGYLDQERDTDGGGFGDRRF